MLRITSLNDRPLPSVHSLLGFQAEDLIEQSVTRLIASEYWHLLDKARENCSKIRSAENDQQWG